MVTIQVEGVCDVTILLASDPEGSWCARNNIGKYYPSNFPEYGGSNQVNFIDLTSSRKAIRRIIRRYKYDKEMQYFV